MKRIFCYEIDINAQLAHSGNGPYFLPNDCASLKATAQCTVKFDDGSEVVVGRDAALVPQGVGSFEVIPHVAARTEAVK